MPGIAADGSEDLPNRFCSPPPKPQVDYLKQKLDNAYGELKILTDNIQQIKPNHMKKLIELNSMIGNILVWAQMDEEDRNASSAI